MNALVWEMIWLRAISPFATAEYVKVVIAFTNENGGFFTTAFPHDPESNADPEISTSAPGLIVEGAPTRAALSASSAGL